MRPCFAFTARTATTPAVLAIDDEIGFWGTQPREFRDALAAVEGDTLEVQINSPGGDVMAGLGMYNMLRNSGKNVVTRVTGVAASIASIVMLAGDKREMPSNAFAMIHSVMSGAWGTADEIREQADVVDKVQASLRNIYIDRMGIDEAKAAEPMAKDTWLTAEECLELGFVTSVVDPVQATAKFNTERAALPEHVAKVFEAKTPEQPEDPNKNAEITDEDKNALAEPVAEAIVALAKTAGLEAHAPFLALSCTTVDEAKARLGEAREIVALCRIAGFEAKASEHIRAKATVSAVRAAMVEALADTDVQVDNAAKNKDSDKTGKTSASPPVVNSAAIWASHNKQSQKGA